MRGDLTLVSTLGTEGRVCVDFKLKPRKVLVMVKSCVTSSGLGESPA